jgi:hypothetical protein
VPGRRATGAGSLGKYSGYPPAPLGSVVRVILARPLFLSKSLFSLTSGGINITNKD